MTFGGTSTQQDQAGSSLIGIKSIAMSVVSKGVEQDWSQFMQLVVAVLAL